MVLFRRQWLQNITRENTCVPLTVILKWKGRSTQYCGWKLQPKDRAVPLPFLMYMMKATFEEEESDESEVAQILVLQPGIACWNMSFARQAESTSGII